MHSMRFDNLSRVAVSSRNRREAVRVIGGGLLATQLLGGSNVQARKKQRSTLCLNGQTIQTSNKKKKKKLLKNGATAGACPAVRTCTTNAQCGTGAICAKGVCQTCSVTCNGDSLACGTALNQRLKQGGTVYACPGRYAGSFSSGTITLIGAGNGDDPAANTILDGRDEGRVLSTSDGATVSLVRLRLTRGNSGDAAGGGVYAKGGDLLINDCVITSNRGAVGGGVSVTDGRLKMTNTTVADNTGAIYAGGVSLVRGVQSSIASSTITRNTANNPQYGEGGGIRCYEAPLSISGTEISLNKANEGGGINVFDTTLTLDSATRIANNEAPAYGGGGIYAWLTTLQRNGATIINNTPDNVKERT